MLKKDQHRWMNSVDDHVRGLLEESAEILAWAWSLDRKNPTFFPANTGANLHWIRNKIRQYQQRNEPKLTHEPLELRRARIPRSLSDLVDEQTIRAVYEHQNDETYDEALKVAKSGNRIGTRSFQKILNAVARAYRIVHFGEEAAPKPRIHYLHRSLLDLADLVGLSILTHEGIAEFFDDICPCGRDHGPDAVRKLRNRQRRTRQKKW